MKRIFALTLAVVLVFSLGACGSGETDRGKHSVSSTGDSGEGSGSISNRKAEDSGEGGGSTADINAGDIWKTDYYRDQFEQPTDDWYVVNKDWFIGKFSNAATVNSELAVDMVADFQGNICFLLWRYASIDAVVKNISSTYAEKYNIIMRAQDGTDYHLTGTMHANDAKLFIDNEYVLTVFTAMQNDGDISFYIEEADRSLVHYLFTIQVSNFAEEYNKMADD